MAMLNINEARAALLGHPRRQAIKSLDDPSDLVVGENGMIVRQVKLAVEQRMAVQDLAEPGRPLVGRQKRPEWVS